MTATFTGDFAGQIGVKPRLTRLDAPNNTYDEITTAGYMNKQVALGNTVEPTDFIFAVYLNGFGTFAPIFNNGVITLFPVTGNFVVNPPVATGDFAVFQNAEGQVGDNGYAPTDPSKTDVVMASGSFTTNHIAQIADPNGTIKDGGVLGTAASKAASDITQPTVASVNGSTAGGAIATFTDANGTIEYDTTSFRAQNSASFGGGGTTFTINDANILTTSIVQATLKTSTTVVAFTATPQAGSILITFSADPGANTVIMYTATLAQ